jgi:membrane protease YdiL (CAAX protease family)
VQLQRRTALVTAECDGFYRRKRAMSTTPLAAPHLAAADTGATPAPATGPLAAVRRHPLLVFFALAFGLTWAIQIPWVAGERGWLPFQVPVPLVLLQGWMPGLAAVLVTGIVGGRASVGTLLRRIVIWRVNPLWYAVPIVGTAALWFGGLALDPLIGGGGLAIPSFSTELLIGAAIYLALFFVINSEELAWRGFALPRLQARHGALGASVILGVIEGLFHVPYFFKPESDQAATGLPLFVLGSVGGVILFTWLFNNTRGSVLLAMLFHTFANMWLSIFPASGADQAIAQRAFTAMLVLAALVVVAIYGPGRLSRQPAAALPTITDPPVPQA